MPTIMMSNSIVLAKRIRTQVDDFEIRFLERCRVTYKIVIGLLTFSHKASHGNKNALAPSDPIRSINGN